MAETLLERGRDDIWRVKVTPGRARALVEALDIALRSGELDKSFKGTVTSHRNLFASVAAGEAMQRNPTRFVYIASDIGPNGEELTKIGHARDLVQRFARMTDRLTPLKPRAAWRFDTMRAAMKREREARERYEAFDGGGGSEWVRVPVEKVLFDLTEEWGNPVMRSEQ
jgi:hypothetical protein